MKLKGQQPVPGTGALYPAFLLLMMYGLHRGGVPWLAWDDDLVFTTRTGQHVAPRNLVRSFGRLIDG